MNKSLSMVDFSETVQQFSLAELESLVEKLQAYIRQQRQLLVTSSILETTSQGIDPLDKIIGMVHSGMTDWADQHDYYLGQSHNHITRSTKRSFVPLVQSFALYSWLTVKLVDS